MLNATKFALYPFALKTFAVFVSSSVVVHEADISGSVITSYLDLSGSTITSEIDLSGSIISD